MSDKISTQKVGADFSKMCYNLLGQAAEEAKKYLFIPVWEEYVMLVPKYILEAGINYSSQHWRTGEFEYKPGVRVMLHGFYVSVGYENAIVFFHKDYPLTQADNQIYKHPIP